MDIKQEITDKIIKHMESAGADWKKPWTSTNKGLPRNGISQTMYTGINSVHLQLQGFLQGYASPDWYTYKQASSIGAQVRKGEKSTFGIFYSPIKIKDKTTGDDKSIPMLKSFYLFNRAQIDGLPEVEIVQNVVDSLEAVEQIVHKVGAVVKHGQSGAFYVPSADYIGMPDIDAFNSSPDYYSTLLHELTHWTGHKSRLDRFAEGVDAYAIEELIAELGSAMLCGIVGIVDSTVDGHAKYLNHWLTGLRNDKNLIMQASSKAWQAVQFVKEE